LKDAPNEPKFLSAGSFIGILDNNLTAINRGKPVKINAPSDMEFERGSLVSLDN